MSTPGNPFTSMLPGFDFLQGLVKNAGAAVPGVGQWIAPTLDPEELDKRINDLKTVQFWLEQNARMLATTIQALEVQRMTLSTLKSMNVSFGDLTEALKIRAPGDMAQAAAPVPAPPPPPPPAPVPAEPAAPPAAEAAPVLQVPAGVIDPMQWWGALTQQFSQIAASAMQDGATDSTRTLAGQLVQQGLDAASASIGQAAAATKPAAAPAARRAPAGKAARPRTATAPKAPTRSSKTR